MFYPTRERVRSELRYGLDELLRAGAIQRSRSRTPGLLVVVATGGAATTALLMRKRRSIHDRTQEEAAPALDEPVPVRAGD